MGTKGPTPYCAHALVRDGFLSLGFFLISLSRKIGSQEINETVLEASLKPRRLETASGDKPGGIWSAF